MKETRPSAECPPQIRSLRVRRWIQLARASVQHVISMRNRQNECVDRYRHGQRHSIDPCSADETGTKMAKRIPAHELVQGGLTETEAAQMVDDTPAVLHHHLCSPC
jgi:hypothetical protein